MSNAELRHFWEDEYYYEWIDDLADYEEKVLEDDVMDHYETTYETTEDQIRESVEWSGTFNFTKTELINHGQNVLNRSSANPPSRRVTIGEDNVLGEYRDYVRQCIVEDVLCEVRERMEQRTDVLII